MSQDQSFSQDSYEACLRSLVTFYGIHVDMDGLIDGLARESGAVTFEDLKLLADKLDLEYKEITLLFNKLDTLAVPAILIFDDGAGAYYPDSRHQGHFVLPGLSEEDAQTNNLVQRYSGKAVILAPRDKQNAVDITHMDSSHTLDWFWSPIKRFMPRYMEIIYCSVFINVLALAMPLFTLNVYDRVVVNFVQETLFVLAFGVIAALVFDFFFKVMRNYILQHIAAKISVEYDGILMDRLMNIRDVDIGLSVGEKSNLFRELQGIKDFYASRLLPTIVDVPFFFLFTGVIYFMAPPLALVPIIAAIVITGINVATQFVVERYTAQHFTALQNKSSFLVEQLAGITTIGQMGAGGYKLFQWQQVSGNSAEASRQNNFVTSCNANLSLFVTQVAQVSLVFLGVYLIDAGALTVGGLIAATIIYGRTMAPISSLSSVVAYLKQSRSVLETIDKIFTLPHVEESVTQQSEKGPFSGQIELKGVSYQYAGQARPALTNLNLMINAGDKIGLIGKTGAGKTTLSEILVGGIVPQQGDVFLDGYVYKSIAHSELKRSIGYVPQQPHFFKGTIRDNILMGNAKLGEDALNEAVKMSGLDLVVQQVGEGLDMEVGENGRRLSGGQKQAIALARVLVRRPDILVFDEPTNGMDNALEARVMKSLHAFLKDRTFILVTHRTTLLPLVNRLILLDRGNVIADGGRDEIIKKLSEGGV